MRTQHDIGFTTILLYITCLQIYNKSHTLPTDNKYISKVITVVNLNRNYPARNFGLTKNYTNDNNCFDYAVVYLRILKNSEKRKEFTLDNLHHIFQFDSYL